MSEFFIRYMGIEFMMVKGVSLSIANESCMEQTQLPDVNKTQRPPLYNSSACFAHALLTEG